MAGGAFKPALEGRVSGTVQAQTSKSGDCCDCAETAGDDLVFAESERSLQQIERRRSGLQNVDVGLADGQERLEWHDQSTVRKIWIAATWTGREFDADCQRRIAATDRFKGGSAGFETRTIPETITMQTPK